MLYLLNCSLHSLKNYYNLSTLCKINRVKNHSSEIQIYLICFCWGHSVSASIVTTSPAFTFSKVINLPFMVVLRLS
jgi:hypothetical protein